MLNAIAFLEQLGSDAALRHTSRNKLEEALSAAKIHPSIRTAIAAGDHDSTLESLLGGRSNICCGLHAPEDDEIEEAGATV